MANIQVNIDVNNEDFKNLCLENINDLPKDKMEELLLKAVEVALIRDKENPYVDPSAILVRRDRNYKYEPTDIMKEIINNINIKHYLDPIAEEVAQYIKENYKNIVQDYIVTAFTKLLFSELTEYRVKDEIVSWLRGT